MNTPGPDPVPARSAAPDLVHVHRGDLVESVHRGTFVVLEGETTLLSAGIPELVTYYRSTAKPLQALAVVTSGAADRFGFDDEALAIAAGSHNASPRHLAVVADMLAKLGLDESHLGCGGHWSIDAKLARHQCAQHGPDLDPLPPLWSNCSGKHAGMLAAARSLDAPTEGYLAFDHPVQEEIHRLVAAFGGVPVESLVLAVDGCGAPAHGLSVHAMAHSMQRLGSPGAELAPADAEAARRVGAAMTLHPDMVAGEGRFDTDLMKTAGTRILAKAGAEGVHGLAVPDRNLGLAVKVEDGKDRGYRQLVIELLRRLEVLSDAEADALAERHGRTIRNFAGTAVGRLEVVV